MRRVPRVAMSLAECQHHSAQRPKKARAWEEEREVHYTAAFRTTVLPPEPELFDLFEEPSGERPNLLLEPQGPQERVQRNTVVHIVDVSPFVQILDVLVPDQMVEFMKIHDTQSPVEQVIAVPKLSSNRIPQRFVDRRRPQRAEQLVEVPTEPAHVKQFVDISVLCGGERRLQGFLPEQNSAASSVEQIIDTPVSTWRSSIS